MILLLILQLKQKAIQTIAAAQFQATGTTGLQLPAAGLIASDRGCRPGVAAGTTETAQTSSVQLLLARGTGTVSVTSVLSDYSAMTTLLCQTSGLCCITNLCNTMSRVEMSFVAMFMTIALAVFGVYNGF